MREKSRDVTGLADDVFYRKPLKPLEFPPLFQVPSRRGEFIVRWAVSSKPRFGPVEGTAHTGRLPHHIHPVLPFETLLPLRQPVPGPPSAVTVIRWWPLLRVNQVLPRLATDRAVLMVLQLVAVVETQPAVELPLRVFSFPQVRFFKSKFK